MRIETIRAYRVRQPFVDGPYRMSQGREADGFDAVIVALTAEDGLTGWGEMAPLGSFYAAAFAAGARAGVAELAPHLLGRDPRALGEIGRLLDRAMKGQPYVKSALDMACCDLAARAAGVPLAVQLGGQDGDGVDLYQVVTHGSVEAMAQRAAAMVAGGSRRLQVKVGGEVPGDIERVAAVAGAVPRGTVIFCDANGGWTPFQARQFVEATRTVDYVLEQPCATLEGCLAVRSACGKPMVLDEAVVTLHDLLEIHRTGAADGVTLKIARLGGISATRRLRDLAVELGFMVTVEDTGGAEIVTAAMAHLSLSTPAAQRLHTVAFHRWVTVRTAASAPPVEGSRMGLPDGPGLGIEVLPERLGAPFLDLTVSA
jgi:L-alanine-DL-glutamate epimerase-like enolase superfamily enzyme